MATLVTGGAGYIGSHTAVALHEAGRDLVLLDDLSNSSRVAVDRVRALTSDGVVFVEGDCADDDLLDQVLTEHAVDEVVHFAAFKAVGESVDKPLEYYANNLGSTIALARAMVRRGVERLVFSSSCTVYGQPDTIPVTEQAPTGAASPYGWTKYMSEQVLRDACSSHPLRVVLLRYFNPVGAHPSGTIGEDPHGIPDNLVPFVMQTAVGRRDEIQVFGGDYGTRDGTAIRDYIHVVDLAEGHVAALDALAQPGRLPDDCTAVNLGTGVGSTVLEVLAAASRAVGRDLPHRIVERRPGDIEQIWADPSFAREVLGWEASRGLDEMLADHWRWQSRNPDGYGA